MKNFKDISWLVDEPVYRADSALSYSTLSRFAREGFNKLDKLFEMIETPSLTFGSAVDSIITGGKEEFDSRFMVAEFPSVSDSIVEVVKLLFNEFGATHKTLSSIPDIEVIGFAGQCNYQNNWKPETRAKVIKEKGEGYYQVLHVAGDKTILSTETYNDVTNAVNALKTSSATKEYFAPDNPFDSTIQRFYQLKFKTELHGINFRCMADLLYVNHADKTVLPIDLKTSGKPEWEFYKSFVEWRYDIQARLYWRIIRKCMDESEFADYRLLDYKFIVVNKKTLVPLVWEFLETTCNGPLVYGAENHIQLQDPEVIGAELMEYLNTPHKVPIGIMDNNTLEDWLRKL